MVASPAPESLPQTPEPPPPKELVDEAGIEDKSGTADDVKSDWDASSEEATEVMKADVKDSWDDPSDEEKENQQAPLPAKATSVKVTPGKFGLISLLFIFS